MKLIDLTIPLSIGTPPWLTYEPLQVKYFKRLAPNGANEPSASDSTWAQVLDKAFGIARHMALKDFIALHAGHLLRGSLNRFIDTALAHVHA